MLGHSLVAAAALCATGLQDDSLYNLAGSGHATLSGTLLVPSADEWIAEVVEGAMGSSSRAVAAASVGSNGRFGLVLPKAWSPNSASFSGVVFSRPGWQPLLLEGLPEFPGVSELGPIAVGKYTEVRLGFNDARGRALPPARVSWDCRRWSATSDLPGATASIFVRSWRQRIYVELDDGWLGEYVLERDDLLDGRVQLQAIDVTRKRDGVVLMDSQAATVATGLIECRIELSHSLVSSSAYPCALIWRGDAKQFVLPIVDERCEPGLLTIASAKYHCERILPEDLKDARAIELSPVSWFKLRPPSVVSDGGLSAVVLSLSELGIHGEQDRAWTMAIDADSPYVVENDGCDWRVALPAHLSDRLNSPYIHVHLSNGNCASAVINWTVNSATYVDADSPSPSSLELAVTDLDGRPVAAGPIELRNWSIGCTRYCWTDSHGLASVGGLMRGEYSVRLSDAFWRSSEFYQTLEIGGETSVLDLRLKPQRQIRVRVDAPAGDYLVLLFVGAGRWTSPSLQCVQRLKKDETIADLVLRAVIGERVTVKLVPWSDGRLATVEHLSNWAHNVEGPRVHLQLPALGGVVDCLLK